MLEADQPQDFGDLLLAVADHLEAGTLPSEIADPRVARMVGRLQLQSRLEAGQWCEHPIIIRTYEISPR